MLCENVFGLYRGCLASSIEGDLVPCCNKDPVGCERGHGFEVPPDIVRCPFQYFWFDGLSVENISADAVVHICPKWSNERSTVAQGKRFWCELANLHVEGDHTVVVDLWAEQTGLYFTLQTLQSIILRMMNYTFLSSNKSFEKGLHRWYGRGHWRKWIEWVK